MSGDVALSHEHEPSHVVRRIEDVAERVFFDVGLFVGRRQRICRQAEFSTERMNHRDIHFEDVADDHHVCPAFDARFDTKPVEARIVKRPTQLNWSCQTANAERRRNAIESLDEVQKRIIGQYLIRAPNDVLLGATDRANFRVIENRTRDGCELSPHCVRVAVRHDRQVQVRLGLDVAEQLRNAGANRDAALVVVVVEPLSDNAPKSFDALFAESEGFKHDSRCVIAPEVRVERSRTDGDAIDDPVEPGRIGEDAPFGVLVAVANGIRTATRDLGKCRDDAGDESFAFFFGVGTGAVEVEDDEARDGGHGDSTLVRCDDSLPEWLRESIRFLG